MQKRGLFNQLVKGSRYVCPGLEISSIEDIPAQSDPGKIGETVRIKVPNHQLGKTPWDLGPGLKIGRIKNSPRRSQSSQIGETIPIKIPDHQLSKTPWNLGPG